MDLLDNWFESIRNGNLKEIISIHKSNPELINKFTTMSDGRNNYQTNAIIEASFQGNRDLVKWLIENNADVNSTSDGGWRPIHFAAQHGHVTTVNLLVLGGAEVNVETEAKETPILFALQSYMRDTVKKLLHHGASLEGIDKNYLQMCIQKDILDPSFLDELNKSYLSDTNNYRKIDSNGFDLMSRVHNQEIIEDIKPIKLTKNKLVTEYDNELKRRRQELLKKIRRTNEPPNSLAPLIRRIAQSEIDSEKISIVREILSLIGSQDGVIPQTKFADQMINILELCLCDSTSSDDFIIDASQLMMIVLHNNVRRGDSAVVEFWCRIFDKMTNLQIEQYTTQILKMLLHMMDNATDGVIASLKSHQDTILQNWEYFFENLCFPKCLDSSLMILQRIHTHCSTVVAERFHNVIDIVIGWCIHPDTDLPTMNALCQHSVDLHDCWISDSNNLKKTLSNLQKDILTHCQLLSRIHRIDKDRAQVDELKSKIKFYCFALSCVSAGVSRIRDFNDPPINISEGQHVLPNVFVTSLIEKLAEALVVCSKQIDFDNLLLQSNTVIVHLVSILNESESVGTVYQSIFRYVFGTSLPLQSHLMAATDGPGSTNTTSNYYNRDLLISYLQLIGLCLPRIHLEPAMVIQILSPINWIHSLIFYGATVDHRLFRQYLKLVDIVVSRPQCVPTFYQILLSDLELALNTLLKQSDCVPAVRLVQSNAFKAKTYEAGQAELVIKYNVNLIVLLHSKLLQSTPDDISSSGSAMLIPSVPVLLTRYLLFTEPTIIDRYPSTASFIMHTVAKIRPGPQSIGQYVKYLILMLNASGTGDFQWKYDAFLILQSIIVDHKSVLCATTDGDILVQSILSCIIDLIIAHNDKQCFVTTGLEMIIDMLQWHNDRAAPTKSITDKLLHMAIQFTTHPSYAIRTKCFQLYFNLVTTVKRSGSQLSLLTNDVRSIQLISASGRSFKFPMDLSKTIFNWIIDCNDRTSFIGDQMTRLSDLVTGLRPSTNIATNRLIVIHQMILNACWDCVKQKLKFDRDADSRVTLMTIENMVKSILTNGQSLRTIADKRFRRLMSSFASKSSHDQSLSVNLMIVLLDVLEKMFYNSYEGCSIGLPPVTKATETFFVTNRHICVEWFIKMRLLIVALAQYSGQWSTVVWHGTQLLRTMFDRPNDRQSTAAARQLVPEIEDCIVLTAMAYSKLGNWDSLVGLGHMAVQTFGSRFNWIYALVDKTAGRLESALDKFEKYVSLHHDPEYQRARQASEQPPRLLTRKASSYSSFILCMEEIADCHKLLTNVAGLEAWRDKIQMWRQQSDPPIPEAQKSTINWDRLVCLTKLSSWGDQIDTSAPLKQTDVTWKYRSVIDHCEDVAFLSIADKSPQTSLHLDEFVGSIASIQSICEYPSVFTNVDLMLINERLKLTKEVATGSSPASFIIDGKALSSYSQTLPVSLINFSTAIDNSFENTSPCFPNRKYLIQWHRKHGNFAKCLQLITNCFSTFLKRQFIDQQVSLANSAAPIVQMHLERQWVKLLWQEHNKTDALRQLTSSLRDGLLFETSDAMLHATKCRINTKSLLTLFGWLCQTRSSFVSWCSRDETLSSNIQFLIELAEVPWINGLPLISPQHRSMDKPCCASITDVCSQILILASKSTNHDHSYNSDKSFMTLAQWCLNRSQSLDQAGWQRDPIDLSNRLGQLPPDTIANVELLLRSNFSPSQMKSEQDWFGDCYEDPTFVSELKSSILALDPDITNEMGDAVIKLWYEYMTHHFSLHVAAAEAYFSFLKDAVAPTPSNNDDGLCNQNRTTANLRILSLLGKRSRFVRDSIISKIKTSPPSSWTNVVPQLFARLKHWDPSVRSCMSELLQRLALSSANSSHLIIYPTLVGALTESDNSNSPYHDIKRILVDNNRVLVDDVSMFIKELRRITVLWDELWVSSLGQCYEELNKKTHQLQIEIDKIDSQDDLNNKSVILKLKYNSIIRPAMFILERTRSATSMAPETPREYWFHNFFAEEIANTINEIKSPNDIREFKDAWKRIKDLQEIILAESNHNLKVKFKRGKHHFLSLKLDEVSPSLAKINASLIPLPGMNDKELVSIDDHISILPTKTKPKKFHFLASDGKRYNYLYKGLEDLRLDERVMQILGMANTMFSKINAHESSKYHITTYPVTPLGTRAGLIQMVEDATSLFSLYKRYQMRNKSTTMDLLKSRARHSNNGDNTTEATVVSEEGHPIRPTDIFWQKLRPKLEAAKLDISTENREKWPLSILIDVLTELSRETPSDLLSKELWCCSINSSNWFRSTINFARSSAVMSIMGHLLGLGDRHLDNLLVNFSTGQMVHIDYNVCFDKGVSLKVPEKVPFRLTNIIIDAFGPIGVEGPFKISCQNVYEIIRQSQDSILTLMDTFVFDPIVDWSSGIESGPYGSFDGGKFAVNSHRSLIDKRSVEFAINVNNFQAALVTVEHELRPLQVRLMSQFSSLYDNLQQNRSICHEIELVRQSCQHKRDMIDQLRCYERDGGCQIIEQFEHVRSLEERGTNLDRDIHKRQQQMKSVSIDHGSFFNKILSTTDFISLKLDMKNTAPFIVEHVTNIDKWTRSMNDLLATGSPTDQCDPILAQLQSISGRMEELEDCVTLLDKYRTIIHEMPQAYFASDRCSLMLKITEQLATYSSQCSPDSFTNSLQSYSSIWMNPQDSDAIDKFLHEKSVWSSLLKLESDAIVDLQLKISSQLTSHEDEIQELENIWQLTMFENVAGINIFKAVLLEQYLEMAVATAQLDANTVTKIPESISLGTDYNAPLRKYLQLLNAHENYWKILAQSMNVFGVFLHTNEAAMVGNMMAALQKACISAISFETKFIDIILPESVKIMRRLTNEDIDLLDQLQSIVRDVDNVLLHFNIALTSASYDINNYDNIHRRTVVPLRARIEQLTDMTQVTAHDGGTKQLRILIASFYTTLHQTYQATCDFIDCCMGSSTPSSWNYIDLVAASSVNISPIWNKSITLLKDALFVSGLRCMVNTLDQCRFPAHMAQPIDGSFHNLLRHVESYFNFITKHLMVGVGSQCFGKMFCLLLEQAGWNIDALIAENVVNNGVPPTTALNAEYLCNSIVSIRKSEYPNAVNFYTQLHYCFSKYKSIMGFSTDANSALRFLQRNAAFYRSLASLARNQLTVLCWTNRHHLTTLEQEDLCDSTIASIIDLSAAIDTIPSKLALLKNFVHELDTIQAQLQSIFDETHNLTLSTDVSVQVAKFHHDRTLSISSIKKRIMLVNDVMLNIDRFECMSSRSERGTKFDEEVQQFFTSSRDLVIQLSSCGNLIKPIEEQIIQMKEQYQISSKCWWIDLVSVLEHDISTAMGQMAAKEQMMKEAACSYDNVAKELRSYFSTDYYPLINNLKPSMRSLYSVAKKLKSHLVQDDLSSGSTATHQDVRFRVERILKLSDLMEKFTISVDALIKFLSKDEVICEHEGDMANYIKRLHAQFANVELIKDSIIPDLFGTLMILSPLVTDDNLEEKSSNHCYENDGIIPSKYGFSNNNMAEINGVDPMSRISPSLSGVGDEMFEDAKPIDLSPNNRVPVPSAGPVSHDCTIVDSSNRKFFSNTVGVQKAIEVWKSIENRLNFTAITVNNNVAVDEIKANIDHQQTAIDQYVDKLIRSATSTDNLARMYEGWTAWV